MVNEKTFDDLVDDFINEKIKLLLTETSNKTEKNIYNPVKEQEPENIERIIPFFIESFESHKANITELIELLENSPNNLATINDMFNNIITDYNNDITKFEEYKKHLNSPEILSLIEKLNSLIERYNTLRDSIENKKNTLTTEQKNIQDKLDEISGLSKNLSKYINIANKQKDSLKSMINWLNPHILSIATTLHDNIKKWLLLNKEEVQKYIKDITSKLLEIEVIWLEGSKKDSLYDKDGWYIIDKVITDIGLLINDIENYLDILKDKIWLLKSWKEDVRKWLELDEELFHEREILIELVEIFGNEYVDSIWWTIDHLYSWIDDITESDLEHTEKMSELESTEKPIDLTVLKNNPRAIVLLNMLAEIKIQKYLMKFDPENFGKIISTIPHKSFIEVMTLLKQIVLKYIWDSTDTPESEFEKAKKELKTKMISFNSGEINACEKFIKYIYINLNQKLNPFIIWEIHKLSDPWQKNIATRLNAYRNPDNYTPYDIMLKQGWVNSWTDSKKWFNFDSLSDELFRIFPIINKSLKLKSILKPFIISRCEFLINKAVQENQEITNILWEVKNQKAVKEKQ